VRDFGLENVGDVVVEDRNGVGPSHGEANEAKKSEGGLEGGQVSRGFGDVTFIITDVEIKHRTACTTSELFCEMVRIGDDAGVFDCDFVEGFEAVDDPERLSVLLENAKPFSAI
jgi:hypothetical protein